MPNSKIFNVTSICSARLVLFLALFCMLSQASGANSKEMMCSQSEFIERLRMQEEELINEWRKKLMCGANAQRKLNNYEIAHLSA